MIPNISPRTLTYDLLGVTALTGVAAFFITAIPLSPVYAVPIIAYKAYQVDCLAKKHFELKKESARLYPVHQDHEYRDLTKKYSKEDLPWLKKELEVVKARLELEKSVQEMNDFYLWFKPIVGVFLWQKAINRPTIYTTNSPEHDMRAIQQHINNL